MRCQDCDKAIFTAQLRENKEAAWNELFFYFKFQFNQNYITEETYLQLFEALSRLDINYYEVKEKCETNCGPTESSPS